MASVLAWMNFSEIEQRRAREIVQLFTQRESRDELGIGMVRDVFSNAMFPGVSVIHTRARYFLIIPWIFQKAGERGRSGTQLLAWSTRNERLLIETLRAGGDEEGLIGREAGIKVKTLPSTIYWSSLQRYGILRVAASIEQVAASAGRKASIEDAITEQVDRSDQLWDPYLPPAPAGFPNLDSLNFALADHESSWLRERITQTCNGSLLELLITHRITPGPNEGPWDESWATELPEELQRIVHHADLFSLTMHGASILYNKLLAQRCCDLRLGIGDAVLPDYTTRFQDWQGVIDERSAELAAWDVDDFWAFVASQRPGRTSLAQRFIDSWIHLVRAGATDSPAAQSLVAAREKEQKRGQARLVNDRLLRQWGGSSGTDRLAFRWGQVRRMMSDLNGAEVGDAGT